MAKKEQDKSGAMTLIVMGALIVASSLTWGPYVHWVWPIGAIVIFVGVLTLQMQRNLIGFHIVVTLVLVGLMVTRFTQINQVHSVKHTMKWKLGGTTSKGEGKKVNERVVTLTFSKFPGHTHRLYSSELAAYLENQYKDKPVKASFDVNYDFKTPRRFRIRALAGKQLSLNPSSSAIQIFGAGGGRKPDADEQNSPWAFPK